MSMYNTELICFSCKEEERNRPDYKLAEARDLKEYAQQLQVRGMHTQSDNVLKVAFRLEKEYRDAESARLDTKIPNS